MTESRPAESQQHSLQRVWRFWLSHPLQQLSVDRIPLTRIQRCFVSTAEIAAWKWRGSKRLWIVRDLEWFSDRSQMKSVREKHIRYCEKSCEYRGSIVWSALSWHGEASSHNVITVRYASIHTVSDLAGYKQMILWWRDLPFLWFPASLYLGIVQLYSKLSDALRPFRDPGSQETIQ
jgi:hypothetical protein